jgi:hypothetical protein
MPGTGNATSMRAPLFYALCLLACLAMAGVAAAPAFEKTGAAVEADALPGVGVRFDGGAIAQFGATDDVAATGPPAISGALSGTALAALTPFDPATSKGARLLIGPATRPLLNGAQTLMLKFAPLPEPDLSPGMAHVGFVVAGVPIVWVGVTMPEGDGTQVVRVALPRPSGPPLALAIHPSTAGEGRGFQVLDLALVTATGLQSADPN